MPLKHHGDCGLPDAQTFGELHLGQLLLLSELANRIAELEPKLDVAGLYGAQTEELRGRSDLPALSFEAGLFSFIYCSPALALQV